MKYAVVTGGTRGIGFAVCRLLVQKGYSVTAFYSQEGERTEAAKAALPQVNFVRADVANSAEVEGAFASLKRVDLLVNNAGISLFAQIQDTAEEEYDRLFSVNMKGAYLCAKLAAKKMISQGDGGAIVNLSSVWGQAGGSCETAYSATKGGLIAFTKALAKELAPSHVTVNCVAPGVVDTEMNGRLNDEEKNALCEEIPLGRMASCEEIASAVLFMAEHGYITGEVLSVNGGFYM